MTDKDAASAARRRIGARIRARRRGLGMTQAQVSGSCVTRNMLSLIENGEAAPSLSTLTAIAAQLDAPLGYFFAQSDEEAAQFLKLDKIGGIRAAFAAGDWSRCLALCGALPHPDDEILFITARSEAALAGEAMARGALRSAAAHWDAAAAAEASSVYGDGAIAASAAYWTTLIRSLDRPDIPPEAEEPGRWPRAQIDPEVFLYMRALRLAEAGDADAAGAILAAGLIRLPPRQAYLSGRLALLRGETEAAEEAFRRALAEESAGFFTRLRATEALEACAAQSGDYRCAYRCASQRIKLLEQFAK